jgi:hypothetical protein
MDKILNVYGGRAEKMSCGRVRLTANEVRVKPFRSSNLLVSARKIIKGVGRAIV